MQKNLAEIRPNPMDESHWQIFETMEDAVVLVEVESRHIQWCNASAEALFGYSRQELIGQSTETIHLDKFHFCEFGRISQVAIERDGIFRGYFAMKTREGTPFVSHHRIVLIKNQEDREFALSFIEPTDELRHKSHSSALAAFIGPRIRDASSVEDAAEALIEIVCQMYGWVYGEIWRQSSDNLLRLFANWHQPDRHFDEFAHASETLSFEEGHGLVGRVFKSGEVETIPDLEAEPDLIFRRTFLAKRSGAKAFAGIPLKLNGDVVGVMILVDRRSREKDIESVQALSDSLANVVDEVGLYFLMSKLSQTAFQESPTSADKGAKTGNFFDDGLPAFVFHPVFQEIIDINSTARLLIDRPPNEIIGGSISDFLNVDPNKLSMSDNRFGLAFTSFGDDDTASNKSGYFISRQVIWNGEIVIAGVCIAERFLDDLSASHLSEPRILIASKILKMTNREREVLSCLLVKDSSKAAARELGISHRTVETHRAAIIRLFDADSLHVVVQRLSSLFY